METIKSTDALPIAGVIGTIPHRLALAGGWIDQPFVSRLNPQPPGSMVVVCIEPTFKVLERAGFASGTRTVALKLWGQELPDRAPELLVRELYEAENKGKAEVSGSQDMIGLIYPGINRLDYRYSVHDGIFPAHIETIKCTEVAAWLERVLNLLPIGSRPDGYSPLVEKNLHPEWIARLGQTGKDCFDAIRRMNIEALGNSMNDCMVCWEKLLPYVVKHPLIKTDLKAILRAYQDHYPGAMYSGCGGGYLLVVSEDPVPGAIKIKVRLAHP